MIPVTTVAEYIVTFEALPEEDDMRDYYVNHCGWSEEEVARLEEQSLAWFCARVRLWKDGVSVAEYYLGCCHYASEQDFYTKYRAKYFADMVSDCLLDLDETLLEVQWRARIEAGL